MEWVVGVEQGGKVEVHGDVTVDRSGREMLDGGWNFSLRDPIKWFEQTISR